MDEKHGAARQGESTQVLVGHGGDNSTVNSTVMNMPECPANVVHPTAKEYVELVGERCKMNAVRGLVRRAVLADDDGDVDGLRAALRAIGMIVGVSFPE